VTSATNERAFFAFKLHQFISGAGHAFATLEPPGSGGHGRRPAVPPDDSRSASTPVHFCRECGHEYHPVRIVDDGRPEALPRRDIDDAAPPSDEDDERPTDAADDNESSAFVTLHRWTRTSRSTTATRTTPRPGSSTTPLATAAQALLPEGARSTLRASPPTAASARAPAWFIPGKFRFCLRCGDTRAAPPATATASRRSRPKVEAPPPPCSSAACCAGCTVPQSGCPADTRKLLGFTDNRQDAALQAGHFNDFLFVSLIRAGFLGALASGGRQGCAATSSARRSRRRSASTAPIRDRAEWLQEPTSRASTSRRPRADAATGARLPGLVRPAPRLALHEPEPGAARPGRSRVPRPRRARGDDEEFEKRPPLLKRTRPPRCAPTLYRELSTTCASGWRSRARCSTTVARADGRAVAQPHPRALGLRRDEKPRGALAHGDHRRRKDNSAARRGPHRARRLAQRARQAALERAACGTATAPRRAFKSKEIDALIGTCCGRDRSWLVSEENTPFDSRGWR
jgi:hypothetical protein